MTVQAEQFDASLADPPQDVLDRVFKQVMREYVCVEPYEFVARDQLTQEAFDILWRYVVKESSPGLPLAELGNSNEKLKAEFGDALIELFGLRWDALGRFELSEMGKDAEDPVWLVNNGFCDPTRTFVKNEETRVAKLLQGRCRLIFSVSIIDQMIERHLFTKLDEYEIDHWRDIPSKPGFGLGTPAQRAEFFKYIQPKLDRRCESDVIGWDWKVRWWMMKLEGETRVALSKQPANSAYARRVRNRLWCMARKVVALSDGRLYAQLNPGILPSGSKITSSAGSRMRRGVVLAVHETPFEGVEPAAEVPTSDSMGDDCNEDLQERAMERYAAIGFPLKMYERCVKEGRIRFEFCSHEFSPENVYPLNINKGTRKLLRKKPMKDDYEQWLAVWASHPEFERYRAVVDRVWWNPEKKTEN